uniref:Uncharacterized protein n=1 Tax=Cannabis sativa TaxID=3483 RepID=A0A803Q2E3_CANSA
MSENTVKQLSTSQSIRQWQMPLGSIVLQFPNEFVWKSSVIVLNYLRVKLLHPSEFDEESSEISVHLLENFPLHTVPESLVAVTSPKLVYVRSEAAVSPRLLDENQPRRGSAGGHRRRRKRKRMWRLQWWLLLMRWCLERERM